MRLARRAVLASLLSIAAAGVPHLAHAHPTSSGPEGAYTVTAGDSWYRIADRQGVSVGALLRVNGAELSSVLLPGQRLVLPAGASSLVSGSGGSVPAASGSEGSVPASGSDGSGGSYTVVSGDGWFRIADRHGVSVGALLQVNGAELSSVLLPGQRLALPAGAVVASAVAGDAASGVSSPAPTGAASTGNASIDTVVAYVRDQLGKPYQFFTRGPDTFDCSGLTVAAYAQVGITLVHHSATQATQGRAVDLANEAIRPGDLIFQRRRGAATINHVGIAVGPTTWIQATGPGEGVRIGRIPDASTIAEVRRYIEG